MRLGKKQESTEGHVWSSGPQHFMEKLWDLHWSQKHRKGYVNVSCFHYKVVDWK